MIFSQSKCFIMKKQILTLLFFIIYILSFLSDGFCSVTKEEFPYSFEISYKYYDMKFTNQLFINANLEVNEPRVFGYLTKIGCGIRVNDEQKGEFIYRASLVDANFMKTVSGGYSKDISCQTEDGGWASAQAVIAPNPIFYLYGYSLLDFTNSESRTFDSKLFQLKGGFGYNIIENANHGIRLFRIILFTKTGLSSIKISEKFYKDLQRDLNINHLGFETGLNCNFYFNLNLLKFKFGSDLRDLFYNNNVHFLAFNLESNLKLIKPLYFNHNFLYLSIKFEYERAFLKRNVNTISSFTLGLIYIYDPFN
jgi:hypothetical protein